MHKRNDFDLTEYNITWNGSQKNLRRFFAIEIQNVFERVTDENLLGKHIFSIFPHLSRNFNQILIEKLV